MNKIDVVCLKDLKEDLSLLISQEIKSFLSENRKQEVEYLKTDDVLQMLRITKPTLIEWRKQGIIPSYRIATQVRFIKSEIIDAIKNNQTNKYRP